MLKVRLNCPICGIPVRVGSLDGHLEHAHELTGTVTLRLNPVAPYSHEPEPELEAEPEPGSGATPELAPEEKSADQPGEKEPGKKEPKPKRKGKVKTEPEPQPEE